MKITLSLEFSCSRSTKRHQAAPSQKNVWVRKKLEGIRPPPYVEHLNAGGLTEAGSNLVCNCVSNTSQPSRALESKATLRSRKARTSVKRLIRPVTKMFKGSHKQFDHSPADSQPMRNWTGPEETPKELGLWCHELPAEQTWGELPGSMNFSFPWPNHNNLNELAGEAAADGRMSSELEGQNSWTRPADDSFNSSPVSPVIHDLARPIPNFMPNQQVQPSVPPHSSTSSHRFQTNLAALQIRPQSIAVPSLWDLRNESNPIELDGTYNTGGQPRSGQGRQAGPLADKTSQSWYRFSERRLRGGFSNADRMNNPMTMPVLAPAQLGWQRGYFEDSKRAEQDLESKHRPKEVLNSDGELPVVWDSPLVQYPLIGMVESIMHQLQPQGAKFVRALGERAEKLTKEWNGVLRKQWNARGDFSEKELPYFLGAWLSKRRTFWEYDLDTVEYRRDGQTVCSSPTVPLDGQVKMPSRQLHGLEGENRVRSIDTHQKDVECRVVPGPISTAQSDDSLIMSRPATSIISPPLRSFSSATAASTPINGFVWDSPANLGSASSTPPTEYSFLEEAFEFGHCQLSGCHATFSGETRDIRKGNHTRHMNSKHGGGRFYCDSCPASYNRDDNLLNHKRRRHPDQDLPPLKRRQMSKAAEQA
ncbi:hypothetical protein BLS_000631 [Venturia inaequalis]|uniref:C2H2-type domain-containing protein n=1 Tax=Venturia inaequalis TaxID=5025 RepID=A0A8H3U2N7_VENIN|nr:hypothetical protein BLS_000631 [Venturia inaequalis]RDI77589.1 hypothetical protein Vi05172_g12414 [Venturia inaequalis]